VLVPVPHRHPQLDWQREVPALRAKALHRLEALGVRDVEKRIRCERMLTPDGWDRDFEIHLGATFNLAHNLGQLLHLRPRNRFEDLDGVYLVGGGTHPGSGLPVIYESAKISASLLTGDLGIDPGWQTLSDAGASA
jgi:phytoene desaturase